MRRSRALTVAAVATLATLTLASPATAAAPTGRYVALGDSYTSGPLIPTQVDLNCTRSNHDYPSLTAAAIGSASLTDVSCGGATTAAILNPGSRAPGFGVPAPISALT